MKLYLIRHAEAFPVDNGGRDEFRPLTDKGQKDAARIGEACNRLGITFDTIYTSPVLRADETATIINENLTRKTGVNVLDGLGIPGDFNQVRRDLRPLPYDASVALVGHMPFLGECFQYWVGGTAHPGIHLAKSTMVCLESTGFNNGEMILKFMLNRKVMKAIVPE